MQTNSKNQTNQKPEKKPLKIEKLSVKPLKVKSSLKAGAMMMCE
jgi:hypothetical protein